MKIIIEKSYNALGERAATDLLSCIIRVAEPLICPTAGSTPAALYQALVRLVQKDKMDCSRWRFVGLDEWAGMNGQDNGSCRDFLNKELFKPLHIRENQISFFDGRAADLKGECNRAEAFIRQCGGITVAIVGLGLNGHVGMNEPGTRVSMRTHVANISAETQQVGQKYFTEHRDLSKGITLGLATLLEAQHLFLMANGAKKAPVIKQLIEEEEAESLPASFLKCHADFRVYVDNEAAAFLK